MHLDATATWDVDDGPTTTNPIRRLVSTDVLYRQISSGVPCWITTTEGDRHHLPIARWLGGEASTHEDRAADEALLGLCSGPTVDLGCGPGRFTVALADRGVPSLGIDVSATAVEMTVQRGGKAIHGDVFETPRRHGAWAHVLLADGNIGIGGNPLRMLARARQLLAPRGTVVAEVEVGDAEVRNERRRWETHHSVTGWFPWSRVGADAVHALAGASGFAVTSTADVSGRHLVTLSVA